jgi:hypothetical protein
VSIGVEIIAENGKMVDNGTEPGFRRLVRRHGRLRRRRSEVSPTQQCFARFFHAEAVYRPNPPGALPFLRR